MTYAIIEKNKIKAYGSLFDLFPNTSFSTDGANQEFLEENNCVQVEDIGFDPLKEYARSVEPYIQDGKVYASVILPLEKREVNSAPPARWTDFGAAAVFHPLIREFGAKNPVDYPPLVVGFGQAAQGDASTLITLWPALLQAGIIPSATAVAVANLAIDYNLPTDFVQFLSPIK